MPNLDTMQRRSAPLAGGPARSLSVSENRNKYRYFRTDEGGGGSMLPSASQNDASCLRPPASISLHAE